MTGEVKPDLRRLNPDELKTFLAGLEEKPFRAQQVYAWLWQKGAVDFSSMTSLPAGLRSRLAERYSIYPARLTRQEVSRDGTVKTAFSLHDGLLTEGVLIPAGPRMTACISSQVGCPLGCRFCATGALGFTRNLSRGEIFDQVIQLNRLAMERTGSPVSNIVFMGMGEPLLNFTEVAASIGRLTAADGQGISPQRITVSTVGIPKGILSLAEDPVKTHLAVSLHAATNEKRNRIIPANRKFPLEALSAALETYHQKTGRRFTIEYLLLRDVNDSESDARALAAFCKRFPVKINLIEYNPVDGTGFLPSEETRVRSFASFLEKRNLVVNIRKSRGKDIRAACGQLAGSVKTNSR